MTKDDIKIKEERLAELYLTYYRLLISMNEKFQEEEKIKVELTNLAKEIEQDYSDISEEKEDGKELC